MNIITKIKSLFSKKTKYKEYSIDDLVDRDKMIRQLDLENNDSSMVKCNDCGELVPEELVVICSGCGKSGCTECFTCDASTGKYYCENCWEKL